MAIPLYLAQTAAEFASISPKPDHLAWMACHFSPYSTGITNLPARLPEDSLLILNDRTPINGHDPEIVCQMLLDTVSKLHCRGILLDFQHHGCNKIVETAAKLPCPVAVTERYADAVDCAVFLSSPPIHKPFREYIASWKDRDIWLEAALGNEAITVTEKGSTFTQSPADAEYPFYDEMLHCRYRIETEDNAVRFHLHRGRKELSALLEEATALGIVLAVGLYQELGI